MIADLIEASRSRRRFDDHHAEANVHHVPRRRLDDIVIARFERS